MVEQMIRDARRRHTYAPPFLADIFIATQFLSRRKAEEMLRCLAAAYDYCGASYHCRFLPGFDGAAC